jgi:hypothetical protein
MIVLAIPKQSLPYVFEEPRAVYAQIDGEVFRVHFPGLSVRFVKNVFLVEAEMRVRRRGRDPRADLKSRC